MWALAPVSLWGLLAEALKDIGTPISTTLIVGLSVFWFCGFIASLYLHSITLTILRIFAPLAWIVCIWAVLAENQSGSEIVLGFACSIILMLISFSAHIGNLFVSAEAYGNEERFLLRPPSFIQYFLMPLVWAISLAGLLASPLLLANTFWILGGILLPIGVLAFIFGSRSLNSVVRRQVIFVPNGFVVSDPFRLEFPIRIETGQIQSFGITKQLPKGGGENYLNLSMGAIGESIRVELNPPIQAYLLKTSKSGQKLAKVESEKVDSKKADSKTIITATTISFTPTLLLKVGETAKKLFGG